MYLQMMDGLGRALGESDRANREEFAAQLLAQLVRRFQWSPEEVHAISDLLAKVRLLHRCGSGIDQGFGIQMIYPELAQSWYDYKRLLNWGWPQTMTATTGSGGIFIIRAVKVYAAYDIR